MSNIIIPGGLSEKVQKSIERITAFDPSKSGEPYYLAFSGGKDSVVVKALMDMAGVKYDAAYRHTSVDPPELIRFIYDKYKDVMVEYPRYKDGTRITMWNLIPIKRMPPTRLSRYCCEKLKESSGKKRITVTGVRWEEGTLRKNNQGVVTIPEKMAKIKSSETINTKKGGLILNSDNDESRRVVESCYRNHKTLLNPIVDWENRDVWQFIRSEKIPYCSLYDEGLHRLGCIGCPMASEKQRKEQFARWPIYKHNYLLAFQRMIDERERNGKGNDERFGNTPIDVYKRWMYDSNLDGQQSLFGEE